MLDFNVFIPGDVLKKTQDMLAHLPGELERAAFRAAERAAIGARQEIVREVTSTYTISAEDIRKSITVQRGSSLESVAVITARGKAMGAQHFQHTPSVPGTRAKVGVAIKVRKDGQFRPIPGTFLIRGKIGIFRQENEARATKKFGPDQGEVRRHIKRLFSPAVPSMMRKVLEDSQIMEHIHTRMMRELDHEVSHRLLKAAK